MNIINKLKTIFHKHNWKYDNEKHDNQKICSICLKHQKYTKRKWKEYIGYPPMSNLAPAPTSDQYHYLTCNPPIPLSIDPNYPTSSTEYQICLSNTCEYKIKNTTMDICTCKTSCQFQHIIPFNPTHNYPNLTIPNTLEHSRLPLLQLRSFLFPNTPTESLNALNQPNLINPVIQINNSDNTPNTLIITEQPIPSPTSTESFKPFITNPTHPTAILQDIQDIPRPIINNSISSLNLKE